MYDPEFDGQVFNVTSSKHWRVKEVYDGRGSFFQLSKWLKWSNDHEFHPCSGGIVIPKDQFKSDILPELIKLCE